MSNRFQNGRGDSFKISFLFQPSFQMALCCYTDSRFKYYFFISSSLLLLSVIRREILSLIPCRKKALRSENKLSFIKFFYIYDDNIDNHKSDLLRFSNNWQRKYIKLVNKLTVKEKVFFFLFYISFTYFSIYQHTKITIIINKYKLLNYILERRGRSREESYQYFEAAFFLL
jgi:hypothetical protein